MSRLNFIQAVVVSVGLWGLSASVTEARTLTPEEQTVCSALRACVDIVSRHTASEFDFDVLETEFRRFGPIGRHALFSLLESKDGHADIAKLILALGPLTPIERQRVAQKWSPKKAEALMPLLQDGHPMSRDLLLQSLAHSNPATREQARQALTRLPITAQRAPISSGVQKVLLQALSQDPIREAAPYLYRLDAAGSEDAFIALLGSGQREIVTAAYTTLYRSSPAKAFNGLLAEMAGLDTPAQARAIGDMLASRHKSRPDGFYLQFARKMSDDDKLPVLARASGLHAVLTIADGPFPDLTPSRLAAFSALVEGQPFVAQNQYLSYLQNTKAQPALTHIWKVAQSEKWINRDLIAEYYGAHPAQQQVVSDLIRSNDIRAVSAGLKKAKPSHRALIQEQTNHPVTPIALAAKHYLKLRAGPQRNQPCPVRPFDLGDMQAQMPFFESGWMISDTSARVALSREHLTTAHPTATGWLAGYDLAAAKSRVTLKGGTLLHYDNKSGQFEPIGEFSNPMAILPGRPLKLGQSTPIFWIIDRWGPAGADISAFTLNLSGPTPQINHIGVLPRSARGFAVNTNGDLIIGSADKDQMPIQLSKSGAMTFFCSNKTAGFPPRAPK